MTYAEQIDHASQRAAKREILFLRRQLERMIAEGDRVKDEHRRRREACMSDAGLVRILSAEASRRGLPGIDWGEYFRNIGIN